MLETEDFVLNENNDEENNIDDQFLIFELDGEEYGVAIVNIKEIISICEITKVPHNPNYVKGIINLRGDIIAVVDVRERFKKPMRPYDDLTCVIVVEYGDNSLGLVVDNVREVIFLTEKDIVLPPNAKLNYVNQFIKNIGKVEDGVKLILDLDRLLSQE